ncbi:Flp family type IVb pilin [Pseudomonas sp. S5(2021)]|uniref:Flp family type IVb pilin n=1 Tax=Stutzerimonas balearica TaxID=74829 RepID=UPI001CC5C520|nr:Flp family type IVb pilin [Stutzerimonas balearica]MBZ5756616.1 Flp family type IVb pilin [Pseudomonas sp. S5(2021)]MCF6755132.1 Flp family type IVb pilin [Stutzerimonas balearica]
MNIQSIKEAVRKFARDEDGLTIAEYAVAGGLITGAVVLAFTALGGAVQAEIERLTDAITDN